MIREAYNYKYNRLTIRPLNWKAPADYTGAFFLIEGNTSVKNTIISNRNEIILTLYDKNLRCITMMYRISNMQELIAIQLPYLRHLDLLPY